MDVRVFVGILSEFILWGVILTIGSVVLALGAALCGYHIEPSIVWKVGGCLALVRIVVHVIINKDRG